MVVRGVGSRALTMFRAGRSRGAGTARSGNVLSAERRFLVELEDDVAAPTEPVGPTVGEFLVEWLVASEPTRRPTTSVSYERCVRDHVIPHLGQVRLRDLAPEHVRSWQAVLLRTPRRFRDGPLSTTTVRYCHRLLRRALQDALRWELVDRNVCDAVVAPRRADTEMSVWSPPDVRRFLAFVADDRLVAMWRLFLVTGMRRGEVAGLRWIDVDSRGRPVVGAAHVVLVYSAAQVSEPKTKRSRRVIALDAGTVAALREHQTRQGAEREYAQDVWVESGYVFVREDGTPMDPDRISHLFRVTVDAAGLPKIRLHDLRHTAASLALAMGIHPKVVSERLGHSSVAITLDIYSHLTPGLQEDAAERLGEILDVDDVQT